MSALQRPPGVASQAVAGWPQEARTVRVGDDDFACPSFVHRVRQGWQLRFRRVPSTYFADSAYGGTARALQAAVAARAQQLPAIEAMREAVAATPRERALGEREQSRKALKTGVVGVYLIPHRQRRSRTMQYTLMISCPGQKTQRLHVGTDATWQARFEVKLREAWALRERMVEQRMASKAAARHGPRTAAADVGLAKLSRVERPQRETA
jgi:hypothetical protein